MDISQLIAPENVASLIDRVIHPMEMLEGDTPKDSLEGDIPTEDPIPAPHMATEAMVQHPVHIVLAFTHLVQLHHPRLPSLLSGFTDLRLLL